MSSIRTCMYKTTSSIFYQLGFKTLAKITTWFSSSKVKRRLYLFAICVSLVAVRVCLCRPISCMEGLKWVLIETFQRLFAILQFFNLKIITTPIVVDFAQKMLFLQKVCDRQPLNIMSWRFHAQVILLFSLILQYYWFWALYQPVRIKVIYCHTHQLALLSKVYFLVHKHMNTLIV